jgi:hypothetical protein
MRTKATRPTASAPPSRNATTPMATVNAHSAVQTAPNASCARSKLRFRTVAEKARADAAKASRMRCDTLDSTTDCVSSQGVASGPSVRRSADGRTRGVTFRPRLRRCGFAASVANGSSIEPLEVVIPARRSDFKREWRYLSVRNHALLSAHVLNLDRATDCDDRDLGLPPG